MTTFTREREQGTRETITDSADIRINAIQQVVDNKQYAKIDGTMIDLTTAHAIMAVYNALSPENQIKYKSFPAGRMAVMAWKLIK